MAETIGRKKKPVVTIVTPNYRGKYLLDTVRSVLEQTYGKIQYIIVDDGSENFDEAALLAYINENKRNNLVDVIIKHLPQNGGTVHALNCAIAAASGEILFNLACDDVFEDPNVVADWVREFQRTGARCMTAYRLIYEEDMQRLIRRAPRASQVRAIRNLAPEQLFERLICKNFIFGSCTAYTRDCIEQFGRYNERYRLIEDYSYIMMLLRNKQKVAFFNRVVVKCRKGGVSAAENYNESYERDTDLIFTHEIIPYTKKPGRAKRKLKKWKRVHEGERAYNEALQENGLFARLSAAFRFPEAALKRTVFKAMRLKEALTGRAKK